LTTDDQRDHLSTVPLPVARNKVRGWIKVQEAAIEQARSLAAEAREVGNLALSLAALQLATRTQADLIALAAPKKATGKSKSAAETESAESDAEEDEGAIESAPSAPSASIDVSKLSDEELAELTGSKAAPVTPRKPMPASAPTAPLPNVEEMSDEEIAAELARYETPAAAPRKPTAPRIDVSKLSDEELERLVGEEVAPALVTSQRKPSSRPRGRAKGCEASGVAKIAKQRAQERREREQREREASEHPASQHDVAIASPVPIPPGWDE
jgi:hypothetical protein